jgi:mono/diheme cytochrome c family protein
MKTLGLVLAAAGLLAAQPGTNPYEGDRDAARAGAKLYSRHCAACHGKTAEGIGRAPSLRSASVGYVPPSGLFQILTNGVMRRGMPSWAHLPEAQRWQIITYLKTLKDGSLKTEE